MKTRPKSRRAAVLLGALLSLVPLCAAADSFDEVLALLEGGVSEATILAWLDSGDGVLPRPTADELIALQEAGASDDLMRELLRRSGQPGAEGPRAAVADPPAEPGPPAATPAPGAPVANPLPAAAPAAIDRVQVRFRLLYAPRFDEGEESWDLLVYLDGQPLSYVPADVDPFGLTAGDPLQVEVELPTGGHRLRVMQERHQRRRRGWRHAARSAARAFDFELAAGPVAEVELEFRQAWGDLSDPLTFRFTQGDRVADQVEVGGDPDRWPELCEDAGRAPGSSGCVGWSSLWSRKVPSRPEVLDALARFEFRPVPR